MANVYHLKTPFKEEEIRLLNVGDVVYVSGEAFTCRSRLHRYVFDEGNPSPDAALERDLLIHVGPIVVKDPDGTVKELKWKVGGIYGAALEKICAELEKAGKVAENESQARALGLLVEYFRTGDLRKWDEYNIEWVKDTLGQVDYINGFIEDYDDPLGRKATFEG